MVIHTQVYYYGRALPDTCALVMGLSHPHHHHHHCVPTSPNRNPVKLDSKNKTQLIFKQLTDIETTEVTDHNTIGLLVESHPNIWCLVELNKKVTDDYQPTNTFLFFGKRWKWFTDFCPECPFSQYIRSSNSDFKSKFESIFGNLYPEKNPQKIKESQNTYSLYSYHQLRHAQFKKT